MLECLDTLSLVFCGLGELLVFSAVILIGSLYRYRYSGLLAALVCHWLVSGGAALEDNTAWATSFFFVRLGMAIAFSFAMLDLLEGGSSVRRWRSRVFFGLICASVLTPLETGQPETSAPRFFARTILIMIVLTFALAVHWRKVEK